MTVFNIPQFSGNPGFSTVNVHENAGGGIVLRSGATFTLSNQARVVSTANAGVGLLADNGVGVTLVNSTISGNTTRDIQADLRIPCRSADAGVRHLQLRRDGAGPGNRRHLLPALDPPAAR